MAELCSTALIIGVAWLVTACAVDIGMEISRHDSRLIRRATRKRRIIGAADTVAAQIQPHGNVLSPELAEHNANDDLEGKASHQKVTDTRDRLMRMVARADGDTEKMGKPIEEEIAELDDIEHPADPPNPHQGKVTIEHKFRGCFPLADEDDLSSDFHDKTCMKTLQGEMPCRGGLPFFRLPMAAGQSYLDCFTFCLSKGLDLSGIVNLEKNKECRCGATVENAGAWHRQQPKQQLLLPSRKLKADDPNCKLLVWEYTGGLTEDDSVPYLLLQTSDADREYMESIATGHAAEKEQDEPDDMDDTPIPDINFTRDGDRAQPNASLLKISGICEDDPEVECDRFLYYCRRTNMSYGQYITTKCPVKCGICTKKGSFPPCYPYNCAGGHGLWQTKRSDGKVYIPYFFEDNVDNARKDVFRKATDEYHQRTCIRWVLSGSDVRPPRFSVGIYDTGECWANVGYPGPTGTYKINLGWCKTDGSLGSIIHELGHAIGMKHEHQRMDAGQELTIDGKTRGPYLNMYWKNIKKKKNYVPSLGAYVGSVKDSDTDTHVGYAPYDFESIMHYGRSLFFSEYDTIPASYATVVGQRNSLSTGDLKQIEDMYQCRPPSVTPAPPKRCDWWCWFSFGKCRWRKWCGGCDKCKSALQTRAATQDTTEPNNASSSQASSLNESAGEEDPEDDVAVWVADAWGACKKGKVICIRSRQVMCESPDGKELKEIKCDFSQKPLSQQACYCDEITKVPQACAQEAQEHSSFGNKSCQKWRHGLDCLSVDPSGGLQSRCPHICGMC